MSVFVARENNRLSQKFEGVASDNELQSESENEEFVPEIHLEETKEEVELSEGWNKQEYETLVQQLKGSLPKKDTRKWKTSLEAIDWQQIKVGKRPNDEVERVAKEIIAKVRTFRTLSEILADMPDVVSKLLCATRPKPPLTAYSLFVKEKLPQLREEHKELKVQQIFKLIPELFKGLSAKKRRRYETDAAKKKEEYQAQLQKFYVDHPDLSPKKGYKPKKEPLKTPFHLFYQERRAISANISFQQARREWEELPLKQKVVFIQKSFEVQGGTDLKLVNKREMELLDHSLGKPEFCGRNAYEFYRRKMKTQPGKEQEAKIRDDYKHLNEQELEALREEYQQARTKFVNQYREYIKKLPREKQQAEIDYLLTITEKTKTKKVKSEKLNTTAEEDHYPGSPDDPPAAESTTIRKKPPAKATTKVATIKKEHKSDPSDVDSVDHPVSPKKRASKTPAATPVAAVASPSKRKQPASVAKSEPKSASASSSDDHGEDGRAPPKRNASPVKNGAKKRTSSEDQPPAVAAKKTKVKKEQTEQPPAAPVAVVKSTLKEPEKPPRDAEEFYRQRLYKGKVGKHKEAYANLSSAKKREIVEQLKAAQKKYIVDFEVFLKSLPKEEIRKYIEQRAKEQHKLDKTEDSDDDDDDDDDDEEDESSSEEEDDD